MKKNNYISIPLKELDFIINDIHEINLVSQVLYYKLLSNKNKGCKADALIIYRLSIKLMECLQDYVN